MVKIQSTWQNLSFFISSVHSQNYLSHCYKTLHIEEGDRRSFDNCYPFIYYLEHGKSYYELANISPLSIKPVLLFYGMIQLLKACLLTVDPNYPESTSVLAHGVTTRKRKKQSYEFLQDEVKIQKNGLFTHIAEHMFHVKHLEGEKYTMEMLLKQVGELIDLFSYSKKTSDYVQIGRTNEREISIAHSILDRYHMTSERFIEHFSNLCPHLDIQYGQVGDEQSLCFISPVERWNGLSCAPLAYDLHKDLYYFPASRDHKNNLPELLVHYLILYNLSMISRYETEWWSDLLRSYSTEDYPFIHQFLSATAEKVPYYIYLFLIQKAS